MLSSKPCTDKDLVCRYVKGDVRAFEILFNRHKGKVYTCVYCYLKDEKLADDVFQETFIKVIDALRSGTYNLEGKFLKFVLLTAYEIILKVKTSV